MKYFHIVFKVLKNILKNGRQREDISNFLDAITELLFLYCKMVSKKPSPLSNELAFIQ